MSDYGDFVKRMGSFEMDLSLDDIGDDIEETKELKHYGIQGMKWGIRRPTNSSGKVIKNPDAVKRPNVAKRAGTRIKEELKSMQREAKWTKEPFTTFDETILKTKLERLSSENKLKALAPRKEYIKRASVSDAELKSRVARLELENKFKKEVAKATKGQLELGKAVQSAILYDMSSGLVGETASSQVVSYIKKQTKAKTGIRANV